MGTARHRFHASSRPCRVRRDRLWVRPASSTTQPDHPPTWWDCLHTACGRMHPLPAPLARRWRDWHLHPVLLLYVEPPQPRRGAGRGHQPAGEGAGRPAGRPAGGAWVGWGWVGLVLVWAGWAGGRGGAARRPIPLCATAQLADCCWAPRRVAAGVHQRLFVSMDRGFCCNAFCSAGRLGGSTSPKLRAGVWLWGGRHGGGHEDHHRRPCKRPGVHI